MACKICGAYTFYLNDVCGNCKRLHEKTSKSVGNAYHPINGAIEEIFEGFSWPCFFFGALWFLQKGMWGWAIISFILSVCTWGVAWLIFPFFANSLHADSLIKRGYLNEKQWDEKRNQGKKTIEPDYQPVVPPSSIADELSKLATLKEKGILSPEEFDRQKQKLLA